MNEYKQLSKELYETLKDVKKYLPSYKLFSIVDETLQKYEEATTRRTGRTTALYMKAIAEALENPGKTVEFIDHYFPHKIDITKSHASNLGTIVNKLGYRIMVYSDARRVFLVNLFKP